MSLAHTALTAAALAVTPIACGAPSRPPAPPNPPADPAAEAPDPDDPGDADFPDDETRALALRACTGYDRCQELGRAWREGREPDDDGADPDQVSEACLATARGLAPGDLDALRACLDQDCHGGCDCVDWVARWGATFDLECNYGDNPADFRDGDGDE